MKAPSCCVVWQVVLVLAFACCHLTTSCDLQLFRRAAILSSHSIVTSPTDFVNISCSSPCGFIEWTINGESVRTDFDGPAVIERRTNQLCTNSGCTNSHILPCSSAMDGQQLMYSLRLRAKDGFMIQCHARLDFDRMFHSVYSRLAQVVVIRPPEVVVTPSPVVRCSATSADSSSAVNQISRTSTHLSLAVPHTSTHLPLAAPSTTTPPGSRTSQLSTPSVNRMAVLCIGEQQFHIVVIGAVSGLLVIIVLGVIAVLICCGLYIRHSRSKSINFCE